MVDDLYQNWLTTQDSGMRPGFRELFMQQEAAIRAAMQEDPARGSDDD